MDSSPKSISEELAEFGVTHDKDNTYPGRRFIRCQHGPLGLMNAREAESLIALLRTPK